MVEYVAISDVLYIDIMYVGICTSRNLNNFVRVVVGWVRGYVVMCIPTNFVTI